MYLLKMHTGDHTVLQERYHPFDADFLTQNTSSRTVRQYQKKMDKGEEPEIYNFKMKNIILNENDNTITLVAEKRSHTLIVYNNSSNPGMFTYTNSSLASYYGDILVARFTDEGQIEWVEKIFKEQNTSEDYGFFSSYSLAALRDKLYFIFNDHPNNLFLNGNRKPSNFNPRERKNYMVAIVGMDSKGNQEKRVLSLAKDTQILTKPRVSKQITDNEMIIYGQFKNNFRLARASFSEGFFY
jgi:hypothetical protein